MSELLMIQKENAQLQEENEKLQQEIESEERVYLRWKAMAGIFHDTLWSTLSRYDPEYCEQIQNKYRK